MVCDHNKTNNFNLNPRGWCHIALDPSLSASENFQLSATPFEVSGGPVHWTSHNIYLQGLCLWPLKAMVVSKRLQASSHDTGGEFNSKLVVQYLSGAVTLNLAENPPSPHQAPSFNIPYSMWELGGACNKILLSSCSTGIIALAGVTSVTLSGS